MVKFKPQKGKAFDKLPKKTLDTFNNTEYLVSTKYDGNQVFVVKLGHTVRFFTSDWKEFYNEVMALDLLTNTTEDFVVIGEFIYNSLGKLGDRKHSAILTTWRTNFKKDLPNINEHLGKIMVFDILYMPNNLVYSVPYITRLHQAHHALGETTYFSVIEATKMTGSAASTFAKSLVKEGWEGCMLVEPDSTYHIGKRVNHVIKLKYRKTADLLCVGVEPGDGKYSGMIGALLLTDSAGRFVSVGSGLDDGLRSLSPEHFINEVIEVEYEQIMDTYIQPTFVTIRYDKIAEEID